MGVGDAAMVVVARTVKAGDGWEPQCGVGIGGMRVDVTVGWFEIGAGDIVVAMERPGRGALRVTVWNKMRLMGLMTPRRLIAQVLCTLII